MGLNRASPRPRRGERKTRLTALALCAAAALLPWPAVGAAEDSFGFYGVGQADRAVITPITADGSEAAPEIRDLDGDGADEAFYPGSEALLVTLTGTAEDAMYVLTVSSSERMLYADQRTGGGDLAFRVSFAPPERPAELTLEIGATEAGFQKIAVPLSYLPPAPRAVPEPAPEPAPIPGYALCGRGGECPTRLFTDLDPAAWYHDGIHYVLENGIMYGVEDEVFAPAAPTSRGMLVTMLWRMEGMPEAETAPFGDVDPDAWYAKAVSWAFAEDIAAGYDAERFAPEEPVSREQLAVVLWRCAGFPDTGDGNLGRFIDAEHISDWAYGGVQWAVNAGILNGTDGERLSPKADASRAQVAAMLARYSRPRPFAPSD